MNSDTMHTTLRYGCYLLLSLAIALGIGNSQAGISIFSNTSFIALTETPNSTTIATPYPSTITVTNLPGQVIDRRAQAFEGFLKLPELAQKIAKCLFNHPAYLLANSW